jgi:uncharacterized protein YdiU (UPF0061 family)
MPWALRTFDCRFETAHATGLGCKIGLVERRSDDLPLAQDLLKRKASNGAAFTLTFRGLCDAAANSDADMALRSQFADAHAFDEWAARWRQRIAEEGGRKRPPGRDAHSEPCIYPAQSFGGGGYLCGREQRGFLPL